MNNMTKCFLVMGTLVAGTFHHGWAIQDHFSRNGEWLILAALKGDSATVDRLLKIGIDVNAQDDWNVTALMDASYGGHAEIVRMLLAARGTKVNTQDRWNETALMKASSKGHTEVVRILIDADADIALTNNEGKTALDLARANGNIEIVKLLENIIAVKTRIKEIAADEWPDCPLDVINDCIMPFLDPDQK